MKVELCAFSGYKIHPGHGIRCTKVDGKTFYLLSRKSCSLFAQRKNPRKIAWTVLFRRKHKKGITNESTRKRARKVVKFQRAVGDVDKDALLKKKAEKPDFRKLQREQAIRAAKDAAKKKAAANKTKSSGGGKSKGQKNQKQTQSKGAKMPGMK